MHYGVLSTTHPNDEASASGVGGIVSRSSKINVAPVIEQLQSGFYNCSGQTSVVERKTLCNQRGSFVHQEFHGTESLIGCPSFFILVLKIGRNS